MKALPREGVWGHVVLAGSSMYIAEYLSPFLKCDAPLPDGRGTLLIKRRVDERKGLRLSREPPGFSRVFG